MFSTDHVTEVLATRGRAFASFVAALDAEEAAAAEMAALAPPMAA
jgi:hypothetical protein